MPARILEEERRSIWEDFCSYLPAKEDEVVPAGSSRVGYRQALVLVAKSHGVGPATVSRIVRYFRSKGTEEPLEQLSPVRTSDLPDDVVDAVERWIREDPTVRWPELEARARRDFGVRSARKRLQKALLNRGVRKSELLAARRRELQRQRESGGLEAPKPTTRFREHHRRKPEMKNGRRGYPSDMTTAEWHRVQQQVESLSLAYRSDKYDLRDLIDAVRYQNRSGCAWRMMPNDFPPYKAVFHFFQAWTRNGSWQKLHDALVADVRTSSERRVNGRVEPRAPKPTVGVVDSQSVDHRGAGEERGYDAGKRRKGRKRNVMVDTLGLILALVVTSAVLQDRDGGALLLEPALLQAKADLQVVYADGAYRGSFEDRCADQDIVAEIVPNGKTPRAGEEATEADRKRGFAITGRRWIVERTFGWLMLCRRLVVDHERTVASSQAQILIAATGRMLSWLANA